MKCPKCGHEFMVTPKLHVPEKRTYEPDWKRGMDPAKQKKK